MATKLQTWRLAARLRGVATGRKKKPFTGAFGVLEAGGGRGDLYTALINGAG